MTLQTNRVISLQERKTSIRLSPIEWKAIETICELENLKRKTLFELIEANKSDEIGLTGGIRLFSTIYYHYFDIRKINSKTRSHYNSPIFEAITKIM